MKPTTLRLKTNVKAESYQMIYVLLTWIKRIKIKIKIKIELSS